ncbi:Hypothetical protein AA314_09608 [Archangium gephyra]|uniref:Uncharacterized protein n=1 Tax=Archangium gephyra TaxID=48 RepID=A0AAC8TJ72_9BACT|nr:Hypothetical protein AA314_09608 [Archangium gephyra]
MAGWMPTEDVPGLSALDECAPFPGGSRSPPAWGRGGRTPPGRLPVASPWLGQWGDPCAFR